MIKTLFKDQFEPYTYFGFDSKSTQPFDGTLFRFPLRSAAQARRSEISKRSYTLQDMDQNIQSLAQKIENQLLFLRNITKVEIYTTKEGPTGQRNVELLYSANAQREIVASSGDSSMFRYFQKSSGISSSLGTSAGVSASGSSSLSRDDFYEKLLETPDNRLPTQITEMKVLVSDYTSGISTPSDRSITQERSASDELLENAAAESDTALGNPREVEYSYTICTGLRSGEVKRMACSSASRHLKLVPLGAVAACTSKKLIRTQDGQPIILSTEIFPVTQGSVRISYHLIISFHTIVNS